mmetsp:Transcript_29565/g.66951  ORF Transcript_29565/g.66951 Transcript_29565/m.66951 type:complete len:243 (-) Transcript_29565:85-813(-)
MLPKINEAGALATLPDARIADMCKTLHTCATSPAGQTQFSKTTTLLLLNCILRHARKDPEFCMRWEQSLRTIAPTFVRKALDESVGKRETIVRLVQKWVKSNWLQVAHKDLKAAIEPFEHLVGGGKNTKSSSSDSRWDVLPSSEQPPAALMAAAGRLGVQGLTTQGLNALVQQLPAYLAVRSAGGLAPAPAAVLSVAASEERSVKPSKKSHKDEDRKAKKRRSPDSHEERKAKKSRRSPGSR